MGNTAKAVIAALAADGIALAVSFGAPITTTQQAAILAFVGSVTAAGAALVAWVETHHIKAKGAVDAAATAAVPPVPPVPVAKAK